MLIKKCDRALEIQSEHDSDSENAKKEKKRVFDSVKALIISPTRELAIQIRDMINAVIPPDYEEHIKTCCLVGGMSIEKQQRLLSYKPAIVIATPGRLWELLDDRMEAFLVNGLPMIDVLVLDEADRMIADGHFKELNLILNHIYTKRVEMKRQARNQKSDASFKGLKASELKEQILDVSKSVDPKNAKSGLRVGANLIKGKGFDEAQIVDLDEEDLGEDENIICEDDKEEDGKKKKKKKQLSKKAIQAKTKEEEEAFKKEYMKIGGIQHIICSATMTIDGSGRITPRQQKILKKKKILASDQKSTLDQLCQTLKFRSKNPKVIDLTEDDEGG